MAKKSCYVAVSRVVENNTVIGLMVRPEGVKTKEIFMSLDVISFGLSQKTFEIENVKLSSTGKPRGCNGFLLSKLPIKTLREEKEVKKDLQSVLAYLIKIMDIEKDSSVHCENTKIGVLYECSISAQLSDYVGLKKEIATEELQKTLRFYHKHMIKELKNKYDKLEGTVDEKGVSTITVSKNMVLEGDKLC